MSRFTEPLKTDAPINGQATTEGGALSEHRWSGWPGAWCIDCGCEDPREIGLAEGNYELDANDIPIVKVTVEQMTCKEHGSSRFDPYMWMRRDAD